MKNTLIALTATAVMSFGSIAVADEPTQGPIAMTDTQMDSVVAGGFVCPVITTDAVLNSANGITIGGGHYSVAGPDVTVPIHATNMDGDGTPFGPHAAPGDTDYTAIWGPGPS